MRHPWQGPTPGDSAPLFEGEIARETARGPGRCAYLRWGWPEAEGWALPVPAGGGRERPETRWEQELRLVPGIGPHREQALRNRGYDTLGSLESHPTWGGRASGVRQAVQRRDLRRLRAFGVPPVELLEVVDPCRVLFFDIETCGLAPVMPLFLIGVLRWDPESRAWSVEQALARGFEEEAAVLAWFENLAGGFEALTSYNGASFDLPFLRARMAANGRLEPQLPALHVDLLPAVRRELRGALPDCRLVTVDAYLTGEVRDPELEIPGHRIPEVYLDYVERQDPALLRPILRHNAQDLKAMARIWSWVRSRAGGRAARRGARGASAGGMAGS